MRTNYLVILNYSSGDIITIKLTREQKIKAKAFAEFENYVESLETEYGFRLKDCSWMVAEDLHIHCYA